MTTDPKTLKRISLILQFCTDKAQSVPELSDLSGYTTSTILSYLKVLRAEKKVYIESWGGFTIQRTNMKPLFRAGDLPDAVQVKSDSQKRSAAFRERIKNGHVPKPMPVRERAPTVIPKFSRQTWCSPLGVPSYAASGLCKMTSSIYECAA